MGIKEIAERVLADHTDWRWDFREYEGNVRAMCVCKDVLGRGKPEEIDAMLREHVAEKIEEAVVAEYDRVYSDVKKEMGLE